MDSIKKRMIPKDSSSSSNSSSSSTLYHEASPHKTVKHDPVITSQSSHSDGSTTLQIEVAGKDGMNVYTTTREEKDKEEDGLPLHPMSESHWIEAIFIEDQDGAVIGLVEFQVVEVQQHSSTADGQASSTMPHPSISFTVPPGVTSVTPYSKCNLHGLWKGRTIEIESSTTSSLSCTNKE